MNKGSKSKALGIFGSLIVLIGTVAGFYWLWNSAQPVTVTNTEVDQKYQKIEISGLKTDAESLIANKQNAGNLPVLAPTADQIGRDNPFAGI